MTNVCNITQYGSTVYIGMAMGSSALYIAIHEEISVFTFNFNSICLLRTSRWKTCERVTVPAKNWMKISQEV